MRILLLSLLVLSPVLARASDAAPVISPELLERWDVPAEKYLNMSPEEQLVVQHDLSLREADRLRRLELLRIAVPKTWEQYVTTKLRLTEEGRRLVDAYEAERKPSAPVSLPSSLIDAGVPAPTAEDMARAQASLGRLFDGGAGRQDPVPAGSDYLMNVHVSRDSLYGVTATNPKTGLTVELGQLGANNQDQILAPSWFGNITKRVESDPQSWIDYRVHGSIGYVGLTSRMFGDTPADTGLDRMSSLGQNLGLPTSGIDSLKTYTDYDDSYQSHGILVTSLLSQVGRAYHLFGPVDAAWTLGNLTKTMYVAPNTAFDETVGLRARLGKEGPYLGLFGGSTQNVSPIGNDIMGEYINDGKIKGGLSVETAPHASAAFWGKAPGMSDVTMSVSGGARWNQDTTVHEGEVAILSTFFNRPIAVKASYSQEKGPAIEFDRKKTRAEIDYQITPNAQAYLAYERDKIQYGNAELDSKAVLGGVNMTLGGNPSLTIDQALKTGYAENSPMGASMKETLDKINRNLVNALQAADKANEAYNDIRSGIDPAQLESRLNALSLALSRLDVEATAQLLNELAKLPLSDAQKSYLSQLILRTLSPDNPSYETVKNALASAWGRDADRILKTLDNASAYLTAHRDEISELIGMMTDEGFWDTIVVRAGRAALLDALKRNGDVKIPVMGRDISIKIDAPAILAAANILQSRLSPVKPVKAGDVDAWLLREAARSLGMDPAGVSEEAIMQRIFDMASESIKKALAEKLAATLDSQLSHYDPAALAAQILAAIPPECADALKQRYGNDLSGLLPPAGSTTAQIRDFILNRLPDQLIDFLRTRFGSDITKGLSQLTAWAGDLLRRELNMMMIQLLLASEQLDRLTVDHGKKVGDLNVRMAMSSFDKLDERSRQKVEDRLRRVVGQETAAADNDDAALAGKFKAYGKASLQALESAPAWPKGLRVSVDEEAWLPLMSSYGDGNFFDLVERMKEKYKASPRPGGLSVVISYDPHNDMGTMIYRSKGSSEIKFVLIRPRDPRQAASRLKGLEDSIVD